MKRINARGSVRTALLIVCVALVGLVCATTAAPPSDRSAQRAGVPGVTATRSPDMSGMVMPTVSSYFPDAPVLVPEGWTATASSQAPGHIANAVLGGVPDAYWESRPRAALPQSVTIDMGGSQEISALSYEARHSAVPQGAIGRFEITVSTNGTDFGTPIATGTWSNTTGVETIGFSPVDVGWVRLTALTYAGRSGSGVTASSLTLYGAPDDVAPSSSVMATTSKNPSIAGKWGKTIGFPLVPVAAALLPDNQLLTWSSNSNESFSAPNTANYTRTAILNLNTGVVTAATVSKTDHNMFCPGVAILPNGEIIVFGGDSDDATSIYDPATDSWSKASPMNIPRGYNGATLLSDGQVFTLGGSWSGGIGRKSAEVWSPTAGWRVLPGVPETSIVNPDNKSRLADSYGWFIATSNDEVLQAGPSSEMHWITTSGAGSIEPAGQRGSSKVSMEGNAVYFNTNQVLALGGAESYTGSDATNDPANKKAYVIDISDGTAAVTQTGSMNYPRIYSSSVVLPNGEVLVVGGQTSGWSFHDTNSVLNPELWNPATGKFTLMAREAEPRNYHSEAVLLPNGEVFSGGGGLCGATCGANHPDGQIFSPPYLFNSNGTRATRPTITSAPASATDGQTITVTTGQPVSSFSLVRYGESTHAADDDQRRIPLSIVSSSGDSYQLAIPSDPGVALPGPYMLFAMNSSGTPSVASTVMISAPSSSASNAYSEAVLSDGPAVYWPLDGTSAAAASDSSGNQDTATYSSTGITFDSASPVEGSSGSGITLNGSQGEVMASQESTDSQTYTESTWFETNTDQGGYLMSFAGAGDSGIPDTDDHQVWMTDGGQLAIGGAGTGGMSNESTSAYNDGKWHFAVVVANSKQIQLYVDGELVAETTPPTAQDFLGSWLVGCGAPSSGQDGPSSDYFAGTLSDAAFYISDLSASEIESQYEASPASS